MIVIIANYTLSKPIIITCVLQWPISLLFLAITSLLFFMTIINQSSLARTIGGNPTPTRHHHQNHHPKITFLMRNVLNVTHPSPDPATTTFTSQIPFPKPRGYFPPNGGIPLPQSNPTMPAAGSSSAHALDFSSIGLSFPARAALQELEFGSVTEIAEHLFEGSTIYGSLVVGNATGIFEAGSEDGTSQMVALTANFGNESKDGQRFFGVYKRDVPESHIAVIGGIGKYHGANGYAVIKTVDADSSVVGEENRINKLLSFHVYLSQNFTNHIWENLFIPKEI